MDDQQTLRRRALLRRAGTGALALATLGGATGTGTVAATDADSSGSEPAARRQPSASATQWPQFQADALNSGYTETPGPAEGSVAWRYDTGDPGAATATPPATGTPFDEAPDDARDNVVSSPAVVDGTVYVGSNDGFLYAIDAVSGEEEWAYETGQEVMSSPAVADGTVYVGSHDGRLHAVGTDSGEREWAFEADGPVFASPAYRDGTLYVGTQAGSMYAVDTAGEEVWQRSVADRVDSTAAVVDDTVYVGLWNDDHTGSVVALDAATGEQTKEYPATGEIACSPTVVDGVVYFGDYARTIYAVDTGTAELVWGRQFDGAILASPVVVDGTVYVGGFDGTLWAMDAANGDIEWSFSTGNQIFSSPAVTRDTVYVGSADHSLYAVDRATGDEVFSVETDRPVLSSPAVTAGAVFVGSSDSRVYAVGDPTGGESVSATPPEATDDPTATGTAPVGGSGDGTTADDGPGFGALGALGALGVGAWRRFGAAERDGTAADGDE
ncbi:PQQ-binding-like beta-propeller repeat protein [Halosimplex sp. TS25]|uniref:beta-alanine-activating enzyme beta-propeller domain-containing protein n=1 Tax=Halosimplex rarum TaxID=3396619 RepID=UPI0039ECA702